MYFLGCLSVVVAWYITFSCTQCPFRGHLFFSVLLTVAFLFFCLGQFVVRQDFLVMCLYYCLQVFAAAVGNFHGISVANAPQWVFLWEMFVN